MTTGIFSQSVGKLFSELKLVTDNLSLYVYILQKQFSKVFGYYNCVSILTTQIL